MESDIFSLSICGEHIVGHWGGREKADTFSFGAYKTAWPGWSGFLLCTYLNFHEMNSVDYYKAATTIIPPSIIKCITSVFSSRYWKKTQISKLVKYLRKSLLCSKPAKMEPLNTSSGRYSVFSFIFNRISPTVLLFNVDIHLLFYPGLVLGYAQCVWETPKIHSACHVNTSTVWPVLNGGCALVKCTVPSACSKLTMTSPLFPQMP